MNLKGLFAKKSAVPELRRALKANDLLAAERLIRGSSRIDLVDALNPETVAAITPAMAALLTGPGPALAAPGETFSSRDVSRGSVFFRLLGDLMMAGNLQAADAVLRREQGFFNNWHGRIVMQRIVESRLEEQQKIPLLNLVLAGGHDKMHDLEAVALAAAVRKEKHVVSMLQEKGIGLILRTAQHQQTHQFDGWFVP